MTHGSQRNIECYLSNATNCFNPYAHPRNQEAVTMLLLGSSDKKEVFEKLNESILMQFDVLKRSHPNNVILVPILIIDDLITLMYAGYSMDDILNFTHHFMKHIENVSIGHEDLSNHYFPHLSSMFFLLISKRENYSLAYNVIPDFPKM